MLLVLNDLGTVTSLMIKAKRNSIYNLNDYGNKKCNLQV